MKNASLQTLETVKARLNERYASCGRWETVASEFGISVGTAVRVAGGYEPKSAKVRAALGFPVLASVPVCACGQVHVRTRCPNRPPATRRRGLTPRQKRAVRMLGGLWR